MPLHFLYSPATGVGDAPQTHYMEPKQQGQPTFLEFLPVSLFGSVMGLTGLSFCWGWAETLWAFPAAVKTGIEVLAVLSFVLLSFGYLLKFIRYPETVKAEFRHPVSVSFFGTFFISLLLLPGVLLPYLPRLAEFIWMAGAAGIFLFAWYVLRKWFDHQQEPGSAMPAWIIPVVGTLDVPVVGYRLPIPGIHEICLVFFAVGIFFAVILMTVILSRLLFQAPLPEALQPTLLILVGPFALAFSGYESLTGAQDILAGIFYYSSLFLFLLFGSKIFLLPACCPFRVTWWAVGFPLVAITIASFRYASHKHAGIYQVVPGLLLTVSSLTVLYLLCQTVYRIISGNLFLVKPAAEKATQLLEPAH